MFTEMEVLQNKYENSLDAMIGALDLWYKRSSMQDLPKVQKVHVCDPDERMHMCKSMEMLHKTLQLLNMELVTMVP